MTEKSLSEEIATRCGALIRITLVIAINVWPAALGLIYMAYYMQFSSVPELMQMCGGYDNVCASEILVQQFYAKMGVGITAVVLCGAYAWCIGVPISQRLFPKTFGIDEDST